MNDHELETLIHSMAPEKVWALGKKVGLMEGVRRFAWWKDGVQYVGTIGKTLKQALEEIEKES